MDTRSKPFFKDIKDRKVKRGWSKRNYSR